MTKTYIKLIEEEKTEVEHFSSGVTSWAIKLLFKASFPWTDKEPEYLPIVINELVDGDDKNIINRAKKEAKKFFNNRNTEKWLLNKIS